MSANVTQLYAYGFNFAFLAIFADIEWIELSIEL